MQAQILGLIPPMMAVLFAVAFLVMWRAGQLPRHVLGFAIAYLFFAAGFLTTHLLDPTAAMLFHTTQFFYSIGATVLLASLCERVGQRLSIASMVVVYLLAAVSMAVINGVTSDVGPRLVIVNIGYGVMFAMGVSTLLAAPRRDMMDTAVIVVMALQAADFLIRPTMTLLFERTIDAAIYKESVYYSLISLVLAIKAVTTAIVLIGASLAELVRSLREKGDRDDLTGLYSRGAFEVSVETLLSRARTQNVPVTLIVADIDHFKQVNDIWGHQAGDAAIIGFGNLIDNRTRACDISGRVGGEEFCIAVWNCDSESAERLAQRLRTAFGSLVHGSLGEDIRLTASFGLATAMPGDGYARLFGRADAALYRAKAGGRNRVESAEREIVPSLPASTGETPGPLHAAAR